MVTGILEPASLADGARDFQHGPSGRLGLAQHFERPELPLGMPSGAERNSTENLESQTLAILPSYTETHSISYCGAKRRYAFSWASPHSHSMVPGGLDVMS